MIGDIFHVCNRGVNKENVFLNNSYYKRFVEGLYRINNLPGIIRYERDDLFTDLPQQEKMVEILKWSLLPNHYHLLLYEAIDGGIVKFVKRLGNSYTKYFNIKNDRSGYLFQNKAKMVKIDSQAQQNYIPFYIDLNPLKMLKNNSSNKKENDFELLTNYHWSSFGDYFDVHHFPELVNQSLFFEIFETSKQSYKKEISEWIRNPKSKFKDEP